MLLDFVVFVIWLCCFFVNLKVKCIICFVVFFVNMVFWMVILLLFLWMCLFILLYLFLLFLWIIIRLKLFGCRSGDVMFVICLVGFILMESLSFFWIFSSSFYKEIWLGISFGFLIVFKKIVLNWVSVCILFLGIILLCFM